MFSDQITPIFCQGIVTIVCSGFSELMGLLLRKGKVDDVSDHLCEHQFYGIDGANIDFVVNSGRNCYML